MWIGKLVVKKFVGGGGVRGHVTGQNELARLGFGEAL